MGHFLSACHVDSAMAVTAVLPGPSLVGQYVCFTYAEGNAKRREHLSPLKPALGSQQGQGELLGKKKGFQLGFFSPFPTCSHSREGKVSMACPKAHDRGMFGNNHMGVWEAEMSRGGAATPSEYA